MFGLFKRKSLDYEKKFEDIDNIYRQELKDIANYNSHLFNTNLNIDTAIIDGTKLASVLVKLDIKLPKSWACKDIKDKDIIVHADYDSRCHIEEQPETIRTRAIALAGNIKRGIACLEKLANYFENADICVGEENEMFVLKMPKFPYDKVTGRLPKNMPLWSFVVARHDRRLFINKITLFDAIRNNYTARPNITDYKIEIGNKELLISLHNNMSASLHIGGADYNGFYINGDNLSLLDCESLSQRQFGKGIMILLPRELPLATDNNGTTRLISTIILGDEHKFLITESNAETLNRKTYLVNAEELKNL